MEPEAPSTLDQGEYIALKGKRCPLCMSTDYDYKTNTYEIIDSRTLYITKHCKNCDNDIDETYNLDEWSEA